MLIISDPTPSSTDPSYVLVYKEMTPTLTHIHPLNVDPTSDALYSLSERDSPASMTVRRGARGGGVHVGDVNLVQGLLKLVKGSGTVRFASGVETAATSWVKPSTWTSSGPKRKVTIFGEECEWMERTYADGQTVHPVSFCLLHQTRHIDHRPSS